MKQLILRSGKYLMFFLLINLINLSCDKAEYNIPDVPVDFTVNVQTFGMNVPATAYFLPNRGFGGIVVYCAGFLGDRLEYYAYDAACTNEVLSTCKVIADQELQLNLCPCILDNFIVSCECCGSSFNLADQSAYPIQGDAEFPLKQYRTVLYGDVLRIYN
ncbi:MAG: hypothetical protein ACK5M7_18990 [Draconibacterium sp.]